MTTLLLGIIALTVVLLMGCVSPKMEPVEPLPTYTPYPTPEARVVVVTPTPSPADDYMCFTGKIEVVQGTDWDKNIQIAVIGEQVICAKEWHISNLYGPVGSLESDPDNPLRFRDLKEVLAQYNNLGNNY